MKPLAGLGVLIGACVALGAQAQPAAEYVEIPGGTFPSVVANDASQGLATVDGFMLRSMPVTQGEFDAFLRRHPQWQPAKVPAVFAGDGYLAGWKPGSFLTPTDAKRPVTRVSWFAAKAFCEEEQARLPTWNEWEYVAAASATRRDARSDEHWRAEILAWYARPATELPPPVGGAPNAYGVRDMHAVVWEWVDDFNALLVDADSRSGSDPDKLKFCGAGAINLKDRQNYAILMRVALLSSLRATDSTSSLGFRCARSPASSP